MRAVVLATVLLLVPSIALARDSQSAPLPGYINWQRVLNTCDAGKAAAGRVADLRYRARAAQADADEAAKTKAKDAATKATAAEQLAEQAKSLDATEAEAIKGRAQKVAGAIAAKRHLEPIVDATVFWSANDISDEVIAALNAEDQAKASADLKAANARAAAAEAKATALQKELAAKQKPAAP